MMMITDDDDDDVDGGGSGGGGGDHATVHRLPQNGQQKSNGLILDQYRIIFKLNLQKHCTSINIPIG